MVTTSIASDSEHAGRESVLGATKLAGDRELDRFDLGLQDNRRR